jgi:hypothetical protein
MTDVPSSLLLGMAFGWALNRAGLTHYDRIVNVYRLRDFTVIRFMATAVAVAGCAVQARVAWSAAVPLPVPPTVWIANLSGGVVFGVGMASAGYCPGTIVAEAGEGRLDAWLAGIGGLMVGALLFGLLQPIMMPVLARSRTGSVTLAGLLGARPWLVQLVFSQAVALLLLALPTRRASDCSESLIAERLDGIQE